LIDLPRFLLPAVWVDVRAAVDATGDVCRWAGQLHDVPAAVCETYNAPTTSTVAASIRCDADSASSIIAVVRSGLQQRQLCRHVFLGEQKRAAVSF
jgi:hypothetical protein